jgi:2-polyprenyl-6-hydroxyphenyl methylase/3-demethylubiquinone-9 3-methyltransferase
MRRAGAASQSAERSRSGRFQNGAAPIPTRNGLVATVWSQRSGRKGLVMVVFARHRRDGTVDPEDVARFDRLGAEWWSPDGPMRALHKLNPVRVAYIRAEISRWLMAAGTPSDCGAEAPLVGLTILDIGCGGGILAEPLAGLGAAVTAIDPAGRNIEIARAHAQRRALDIAYRCTSAEALVGEDARFDVVLAMEVIEHVRDMRGFLRHAAALVRPGGLLVAATLNRTLKSYAFAIVGAEYVLGWMPRGTHDWNRFVTPGELARALRAARLVPAGETGVVYAPVGDRWQLSRDMGINYMMSASRPV